MYYYWQYQMALILFNSNLVLDVQDHEEFKKWITIRDSFPDEGEPCKVVSYHRIGDFCSEFFMKSGEQIYLKLQGVYDNGFTKYKVINGSLEDAIKYVSNVINNCVKGANMHHLDALVKIFDNYIPGGIRPSWFDEVEFYFIDEPKKEEFDELKYSIATEVAYMNADFGCDLVDFVASLHFQPFGDLISDYIESCGKKEISLRYMMEDERCGHDCDCHNPWPAIRYIHFENGLKFIKPWYRDTDGNQYHRVLDIKKFLYSLTKEEVNKLKEINKKFREFWKDDPVDWCRLG